MIGISIVSPPRWFLGLFVFAGLAWMFASACGDAPTVKTFECQDSKECKNSELCQSGKCVNADDDKDGWAKGKDCDDKDSSVYPGRREICGNGKDDNCDGQIDEANCVCEEASERPCGLAVGECRQGKQICLGGEWGPCNGSSAPSEEVCDGKDNDCDGKVDEGAPNCCESGQTRPCGDLDKGECKKGSQRCEAGMWKACEGEVKPTDDVCDGKDNDCDGQIDNLKGSSDPLRKDCYTGPDGTRNVGACKEGYVLCKEGRWEEDTACRDQSLPLVEACDGIDNDCDGQIDTDPKNNHRPFEEACYSGPQDTQGKGPCKAGLRRCSGGTWGPCQGEIIPTDEICNGVDDDCDGQIDNRRASPLPLERPCFSGSQGCTAQPDGSWKCVGLCQAGRQSCKAGRWEACQEEVVSALEVCDGKDNDCDGQVDNLPTTSTPLKQACFGGDPALRGKGECKDGEQICSGGQWASCTGSTLPRAEICDGKDNNCDGQIDEGVAAGGPCQTGFPGVCAVGTLACVNNQLLCKQTTPSASEICDGKDNNCDGQVDETFPERGQPCQEPSKKGECAKGTYDRCVGGSLICTSTTAPITELCGDGKDNDCDGQIDENPPCECSLGQRRACYTGPAGTQGVGLCLPGEQICVSGFWGTCANSILPATEVCDGKDNDCDGQVDEGNPGGGATCPISTFPPSAPCRDGVLRCQNGSITCVQTTFPVSEKPCNGVDDDCNGQVDEVSCATAFQCKNGVCALCTQPEDTFCEEFFGICIAPTPCPACVCGYVCRCLFADEFGECHWRTCKNPSSP